MTVQRYSSAVRSESEAYRRYPSVIVTFAFQVTRASPPSELDCKQPQIIDDPWICRLRPLVDVP
jgi:hypothetical protein